MPKATYTAIPAKISGVFLWSRSAMLGLQRAKTPG